MTTHLPLSPRDLYELATRTSYSEFIKYVNSIHAQFDAAGIDTHLAAVTWINYLDRKGAITRDTLINDNQRLTLANQQLEQQIHELRNKQADTAKPVKTAPIKAQDTSNEVDLSAMTPDELQAFLKANAGQIRAAK